MKLNLIFCFWLVFYSKSVAQSDLSTQAYGAKSHGLGTVKLFHQDAWSLVNNVGAMARIQTTEIGITQDQRYGIQELSTTALAVVLKNQIGNLGFSIAKQGDDSYQQHRLGIGLAASKGMMHIGAKAEWQQTYIEGFGTGNALLLSFGWLAELHPKFFFGAQLTNLNKANLSKESPLKIPSLLTVGTTYLPAKNLELHSEVEKEVQSPPIFKVGLQYQLENWIFLRTGLHSHPTALYFGVGLQTKKFGLDYALGQSSPLGNTHHLSLHLKR